MPPWVEHLTRCPESHPVDCSLDSHALAGQRHRCVKQAADCRTPHQLVTTHDYARKGRWGAEERDAEDVRELAASLARKGGDLVKTGANYVKRKGNVAVDAALDLGGRTYDVADAGYHATMSGMMSAWDRIKAWEQRRRKFLSAYDELQPDDPRWDDPKWKTARLQAYLASEFDVPAHSIRPDADRCPPPRPPSQTSPPGSSRKSRKTSKCSVECAGGRLNRMEEYQRAMIRPFTVLKEVLVISNPGSGKSLMYLEALLEVPGVLDYLAGHAATHPRCFVICADAYKACSQFSDEMCKAGGWEPHRSRMHELVSVDADAGRRNKLVNFTTYQKAGIMCTKAGFVPTRDGKMTACALDDCVIVTDEVHVLFTLQDVQPNMMGYVLALREWLRHRRYRKFLALTATPPVSDLALLASFLNYFLPPNTPRHPSAQLAVDEELRFLSAGSAIRAYLPNSSELTRFIDEGALNVDDGERRTACGVGGTRRLRASIAQRLHGINLCMYSNDDDLTVNPKLHAPEFHSFRVDGIEAIPKTKSKKSYRDRIRYMHARYTQIAKAWSKVLIPRIDPDEKTLVFVSEHNEAVKEVHRELAKHATEKALVLLKNESDLKTLATFNAGRGGLLVANTSFATGLTYLGVRVLHQLVATSAELDVQMLGRVRRFCSHGALPVAEWDVRHHIWEPAMAGGTSCEKLLADHVEDQKRIMNGLMSAFWKVSLTRQCFHRITYWDSTATGVDSTEWRAIDKVKQLAAKNLKAVWHATTS